MTRTLVYTPEALTDLSDLFDFIAANNPVRARTYIADIQQRCRTLTVTPMIGVERPLIRAGLRILPLWRRVIIAYELPPDRVDILRVFSGRQNYQLLLGE